MKLRKLVEKLLKPFADSDGKEDSALYWQTLEKMHKKESENENN